MNEALGSDMTLLFGKNLKRIRSRKGISQLILADMVDLSQNFINEIENGRKWISSDTLAQLSAALETEPFQFFLPDRAIENINTEIFNGYIEDMTASYDRMVHDFREQYLGQTGGKDKDEE
jgi:transcriptional regulator with XRE-family HTH domain